MYIEVYISLPPIFLLKLDDSTKSAQFAFFMIEISQLLDCYVERVRMPTFH